MKKTVKRAVAAICGMMRSACASASNRAPAPEKREMVPRPSATMTIPCAPIMTATLRHRTMDTGSVPTCERMDMPAPVR